MPWCVRTSLNNFLGTWLSLAVIQERAGLLSLAVHGSSTQLKRFFVKKHLKLVVPPVHV